MEDHYEKVTTGTFRGQELTYTVALDVLPVHGVSGERLGTASVFSYVAGDERGLASSRPVVFLFNGGPGSSSAFLHLSGIGPKRAAFSDDLKAEFLPPYALVESPESALACADLVFIDPVDAGFGRVCPDVDSAELFSVEGDARYFADLIEQWVTRYDKWQAPKYIVGESYGTIRAPFVATALQMRTPVSGVGLLGQIVNIQEVFERPGNIDGAIAALPSRAATAWYHGVGSKEHDTPEEAASSAICFALGEYANALVQGNRLSGSELRSVAEKLADITGVPADRYVETRLRMSTQDFAKTMLPGHLLGAPDTRYQAEQADATVGETPFDAAYTALIPAYSAAIARFVHGDLGVPANELRYRISDRTAEERWTWDDAAATLFWQIGRPGPAWVYPYPAQITKYLRQTPQGRLFIGTGLYDSLTTVGMVEHLLNHYPIPRDRVVSHWYRSGHMMYSDSGTATQLVSDLVRFISPERNAPVHEQA